MSYEDTAEQDDWFWSGLDPEIAKSLSGEQKQAISEAVRQHSAADMPADIRLSFGRYFLVLMCGKERRSRERLRAERKARPVFTRRNLPLLIAFWGAVTYTTVTAFGMIVKLIFQII